MRTAPSARATQATAAAGPSGSVADDGSMPAARAGPSSPALWASCPRPMLALGEVRHLRLRPARHEFEYPTFFLMLPMRALRAQPDRHLARNRWGLLSFHDRDHGDAGPDALAWLEALLRQEGIADADGEVWLQTYPRVLGYAFKPVSFWYCQREDGTLAAIVAEVNNTFGERHCYVLSGAQLAYGRELQADKIFHVSPFCSVEGRYRFRFMRTAERIVARVEHDDADGPLLITSMAGRLQALDRMAVLRACARMPAMTLALTWRIHWHALRLWLKRVPFFSKPAPPDAFSSRGAPMP